MNVASKSNDVRTPHPTSGVRRQLLDDANFGPHPNILNHP
jgi:hypothetical protein